MFEKLFNYPLCVWYACFFSFHLCTHLYCQVDEERRRISLGMKKSYFDDANVDHNFSGDSENDEIIEDSAVTFNFLPNMHRDDTSSFSHKIQKQEDDVTAILSQAESRASVLPLQVSLDDSASSEDEDATKKQNNFEENNVTAKKLDRREKKKAKEARCVMCMFHFF